MAFSIPWLETVSKKERQRREEKAQKLMFPFGDEQRTAELAVLRALIQTKARDADLLYQLFQAKDCLRPMQDEMPEEQVARGRELLRIDEERRLAAVSALTKSGGQ